MDPRMQAREWFMDRPGTNKYDIEVHVQRSFWHNGFGQAFFRCTRTEPPYACQGFWRGQELEFEWVPRQWLALYMQAYDAGIVAAFTRVMRLEPSLRYGIISSPDGQVEGAEPEPAAPEVAEDTAPGTGFEERTVVEWRVRDRDERLAELGQRERVHDIEPM
jgi:hypothetical protein